MLPGQAVWATPCRTPFPTTLFATLKMLRRQRQHRARGRRVLFWFDEWGGTKNPVAVRELKKWKTTEDRSISNAQLIYSPIANLNLKVAAVSTTSTSARTYSTPVPCPSQRTR